jgi:gluconate 5-dehydrogenase
VTAPGSLFRLDGRIALVTGAARGLGAAMAEALASAGAHVVHNDIDEPAVRARCNELAGRGLSVEGVGFDVTDAAAVRDAVRTVTRAHGRLDVLVNNAGIAVYKTAAEHEDEDWARVMDVDLTALHLVAREAAAAMATSPAGRIINIASVLGLCSRPGVASYVVAKHGVVGLTRVLAGELGPRGITCNAIAPGYFETSLSESLVADKDFHQMIAERTPLRRWARPEELAGPAVFLASSASSFVTGHVLVVDGGMTSALF